MPHLIVGHLTRRTGAVSAAPLVACLVAGLGPVARAQDRPSSPDAESKTAVHASWTQFLGAALVGEGTSDPKLGGKLNGLATIDGRDLGLWEGFSINVSAEYVFGKSVNGSGTGTLFPLNTALAFPSNGDEDFDLSLNFTQQVGASSVTFGKINMLDVVAGTPLVGGGGLDAFQLVGLAASPSFLTPPTILGALWTRVTPGPVVTVGVWDVTSALNQTGLESPFDEGVAGMATVTFPTTTSRGRGIHTLSFMGTTKRGLDLNDIDVLLLPPESEAVLHDKRGGWFVKYAVQQYLWHDPANPARGWGVFGQVGAWDANPTPGSWAMTLGAAGAVPGARRPKDTFGAGFFRVALSRTLRRGLAPILDLGAEQGAEAFYTVGVTDHFRVTANAEWVDPAVRSVGSAMTLGVRTRVVY